MDPYFQIFLTIFSGVSIFVIGQIVIIFFIEPIHQLKNHVRQVLDDLIYYADIYSNPGEHNKQNFNDTNKVLRRNASKLRSLANSIHFYEKWEIIFHLPSKNNILIASRKLIFLSNSLVNGNHQQNADAADEIEFALGIKKQKIV